jgi:hypothetical protein
MMLTDVQEITLPRSALYLPVSAGAGETAGRLAALFDEISAARRQSVFFSGNAQTALADLDALSLEAASDNWDGDESKKLSPISRELARKLILTMPRQWSPPEVGVEADGEVSLDWKAGNSKLLSVTVRENGKLVYAWLFGTERGYGVAEFGESVPAVLAGIVSQIT